MKNTIKLDTNQVYLNLLRRSILHLGKYFVSLHFKPEQA